MKRVSRLVPCFLFALLSLLPAAVKAQEAALAKSLSWRAHIQYLMNIGWQKQVLTVIVPGIQRETRDTLKIWAYYDDMDDDEAAFAKLKAGRLQVICSVSDGMLCYCPEMAAIQLPFLFNGYDEVDSIRRGMLDTFDRIFEEHGLVLLAWLDQGFDQVYSTKYALNEIEQFRSARFVNTYGRLEESLLQAFGAENVFNYSNGPFNPFVRKALADSIICSTELVVTTQAFKEMKYLQAIPIHYAPVVVAVDGKAFQALPEDQRKGILDVRLPLMDLANASLREENGKYLEALVKYGLQTIPVSEAELVKMKETSLSVYESATGTYFKKELLDEIRAHLDEFRAQKGRDAKLEKSVEAAPVR